RAGSAGVRAGFEEPGGARERNRGRNLHCGRGPGGGRAGPDHPQSAARRRSPAQAGFATADARTHAGAREGRSHALRALLTGGAAALFFGCGGPSRPLLILRRSFPSRSARARSSLLALRSESASCCDLAAASWALRDSSWAVLSAARKSTLPRSTACSA